MWKLYGYIVGILLDYSKNIPTTEKPLLVENSSQTRRCLVHVNARQNHRISRDTDSHKTLRLSYASPVLQLTKLVIPS